MDIIDKIPLSRTQEQVVYKNLKRVKRCYAPHNPHYYKDETGKLNAIDLSNIEEADTRIGKSFLKSKNIVSIGFRKDGEKRKYFALRPDFDQKNGNQQLEFSINKVLFDGVEQIVDLSQNTVIDEVTTDLGSVVLKTNRQYAQQCVKATNAVSSFKVEFNVNLKGLTVQHKEDIDEYWIHDSKTGDFRFRIVQPKILTGNFKDINSKWIEDTVEVRNSELCATCKNNCCRKVGCKHLGDDNLCSIYETRPQDCRSWPLFTGDTDCPIGDPTIGLGNTLIRHELIDNGDGSFTYVKESTALFEAIVEYLPAQFLIDAAVYYSDSDDGYLLFGGTTWSTVRDSSYANTLATGLSISEFFKVRTFLTLMNTVYTQEIARSFFPFDVSDVGVAESCDFYVYESGTTGTVADFIVQEINISDPPVVWDFDEFTGSSLGSGASTGDVGWLTTELNSAGITAINNSSTTFTIGGREKDHDYDDVAPVDPEIFGNYTFVCYSEFTGTTYDPYLEITEGTPSTFIPQIMVI